MRSDVRSLLDGYLRDLLTAYEGLTKILPRYKGDVEADTYLQWLEGTGDLESGLMALACSDCWTTDAKVKHVGTNRINGFENLCDDCKKKLKAHRDELAGVITYRSDE